MQGIYQEAPGQQMCSRPEEQQFMSERDANGLEVGSFQEE